MAERALDRYFIEAVVRRRPLPAQPDADDQPSRGAVELSVLGNFAHVWLAKEGHDGIVGINFLEKVQMATPSAALGAMLAGVDYVLMGAGIPREIPQLLTDLAASRPGTLSIDVQDSTRVHTSTIDPVEVLGAHLPVLTRPHFLAIISLHSLASYLSRDPSIRPDGFVVEGPTAGGHSAPPRGRLALDDAGQPVYSARDHADLTAMSRLGLPFWLAGAYGTPERVAEALEAGAAGVQCGTIFALCTESGIAGRCNASWSSSPPVR